MGADPVKNIYSKEVINKIEGSEFLVVVIDGQ